jgi:predicted signal transduction protein with EAL and GGDEF domain
LFVSPAIEAIYQRPPSDFYASSDLWMQVIHPEDRAQVETRWALTLAGAPFEAEYRIVRPDKQPRWVDDRGTAVRSADGAIIRIDRLTRDVTQRRTQQDKIERLTRIRDVLTNVNAAIVRIRDRQQLFETTCRIAVEHGNFKMAWIGVAQPSANKVTPIAWYGHNEGYLEEVGQLLRALPKDPGIAARVLREGTPIVVNHLNTNPRFVFRGAALKRGYRSCVVMPLAVDDSPVAVLNLFSGENGVFDQEEMRLLADLAGDIGLAMAYIENEKKLNFLAYYDVLTGLCNRAVLVERLKQEIAHAHRHNRRAAGVFIDLDNFKLGPVNT